MKRGIYITANDRATDQAIALLNSIRLWDMETPVVLIPYDDNYQAVAEALEQFGVTVYKDLAFIDRLSQQLHEAFGDRFFARPNQFRKQACWFGDFDQFLYIDTDIVVFNKIIDSLNYLAEYDFLCNDYQHAGGIANVFTTKVLEENVFTEAECRTIFNGGFWASKKGLISEAELYATFAECAAHPEYFDFSQKTSDQPIVNYMALKRIPRRFNITQRLEKAPGNWAGSSHFVREGSSTSGVPVRLIDPKVNQPLHYLHWAGIKIQPGCPYWDIWEHYRYLNEPKPEPIDLPKRSVWQRTLDRLVDRLPLAR
ncbi:methionine synthase [Phormidium tenue FACHB-886]|nr:methionine synthase [Phormidium tenue FACHB-886]